MLALPNKIRLGGNTLFIVFLTATTFFTIKSVKMIGRGSALTGKFVFEEIVRVLLGTVFSVILGLSMIANCFGASVGYIIAMRGASKALFAR